MGVDYSGNYGIGVQVLFDNLNEKIAETFEVDVDDADDYVLEYLEDLLMETDYEYFEVRYLGQSNDIFISIKDVFKGGYDITDEVLDLIKFCEDNGLIIVGDVDVVGGLNIY